MFEYFYHEILRRTVIGFGTLFNDIDIRHTNDSDEIISTIKVPLAYGPTQKFLARLEQVPDLNKPVQLTLPRMSFEMTGLSYDPRRKITTTQTFVAPLASNPSEARKTYMPVPYDVTFDLSIYTKLNDDMLQIIEQILPYFQPAYNLTIDLVDKIGEKRDIPINLDSIIMSDDYEGNYQTRRALISTLRFTAKTYLFGPVTDPSKDIIKKVSIGYVAGCETEVPKRELTYTVEPRATQSYTDNVVTTLGEDITNIQTVIDVANSSSISVGGVIVIDNENFRVASKSGNKLTVERGYDETEPTIHVQGAEVQLITNADANLIQFGDNFGFDTF